MNGRMIIPEWVEKSSGGGMMVDGCGNNVYCMMGVFTEECLVCKLFHVKQLFIFCVRVVRRCKSSGKIFWELFYMKHFPVVMGSVCGSGYVY